MFHAHDSHALTLATVAASLRGNPVIATRRVDFHLRHPWQWRRAHKVIAISRAVRDVLIADGVRPSRIALVHSGVDLEEARTAPSMDLRSIIRAGPGARIAVNVGALVRHKDHLTMVEAARLLRDRFPALHWVVAGEGPERSRISSRIRQAGLEGRFHLLGEIPDGIPLIASADLYVASSREEGLGTSVIDALTRGIPVVATAAGGLSELLEGGAGILCPKESPPALADAVARALTDPAEQKRLRIAGATRAMAFGDVRMAEAVRSVYRSLVPAA